MSETQNDIHVSLTPEIAQLLFGVSKPNLEQVHIVIPATSKNYASISENLFLEKTSHQSADIQNIRVEIKNLIVNNTENALNQLQNKLSGTSEIYDDLILLMAQYRRHQDAHKRGTMDFDKFDLSMNKVNSALLHLLNRLEESDLKVM